MSVNKINHEYCSACGERLLFKGTEKRKDGVTLMFYACPFASPDSDHDRAVYEVGTDVEVSA